MFIEENLYKMVYKKKARIDNKKLSLICAFIEGMLWLII